MPKVVPEYREQAKERILKAAAEEFAKRGYRATTMNDIAKRMKVSKGAIYQYYDGKEELIRAMAGPFMGKMLHDAYSPSKRDMKGTAVDAFGRFLARTPDWVFGLMTELYPDAAYNEDIKHLVMEMNKMHLESFCEFWEGRKMEGELPADLDVRAVGKVYLATVIGLIAEVASGLPRSEANEIWKEFVERTAASYESKRRPR